MPLTGFGSAEVGSNPDCHFRSWSQLASHFAWGHQGPMKVFPKQGKCSFAAHWSPRLYQLHLATPARRGHPHGICPGVDGHLDQLILGLRVCVTACVLAGCLHILDQRHIPEGWRKREEQVLRSKRSHRHRGASFPPVPACAPRRPRSAQLPGFTT